MSVVIVDHMDESESAPWHPLYQSFTEVCESNSDLHFLIPRVAVTCPKQHHLQYISPNEPIKQLILIVYQIFIFIFYYTSLWLVKWQLEMVTAVEPIIASIRPS